MKKYTILFLAAGLLMISSSVLAISPSLGSQYNFHLYFDNGKLLADRDFQFQYDIVAVPYEEPVLATGFPYRGEIINFAGQVGATFKFDPRNGSESFKAGKISVKAPYVADGQKAVFYDPQDNAVLTIPVAESSFCNDDGICNADRGEEYLNCPRDCRATSLPAPIPTATSLPGGRDSSGSMTTAVVYTLVGLVLLGGLWWFFKKRGSGPTLPPPSLPTPPPPTPPVNGL